MKESLAALLPPIRISEDLKKSLQKLADDDRRTLTDYVRVQLEKLVESQTKKK